MSDWGAASLGDLASVRFSNVDKKTLPGEKAVRLCNYLDVYENEYIRGHLAFMEASAGSAEIERFRVCRGDVLLTKDSESPDDIGIPSVVVEDIPALVCGYHLALIRPDPRNLDSEYLAKQLAASPTARRFSRLANGSTRYGLSASSISTTKIPTPSLPEQQRIARVLRTLDNGIEQTKALIAKYQQIKAGLMHDLFTRGIGPDGGLRPSREVATHLYKESSLGWIPRDWSVFTIGELLTRRVERGRSGLPVMAITLTEGLVPRGSVDRRVETNLAPEGHLLVRAGDIAYNMMRMWQGSLGRATFDCLVSPAYVVLTPGEHLYSTFAEFLFSTPEAIAVFKRWSYGVVDDRLRLYYRDLVKIRFPIPDSVKEQELIAERITSANNRIETLRVDLAKLRQLKAGLMNDLLTGRVRVDALEAHER